MSVIAAWLYCIDYFHVCITIITFINLFHVCTTFINHVYLKFFFFTSDAQQTEDNYPMLYWTINSYRIVSYRIVSYRIVSYRIVSYRIVSYRIVS